MGKIAGFTHWRSAFLPLFVVVSFPTSHYGDLIMKSVAIFALLLALPLTASAQDDKAKEVAQDVLNKGSALFDTHDAAAMAATYTEDAQLFWLQKDDSTGEIKVTNKNGRAEIEDVYRDIFKDQKKRRPRRTRSNSPASPSRTS